MLSDRGFFFTEKKKCMNVATNELLKFVNTYVYFLNI